MNEPPAISHDNFAETMMRRKVRFEKARRVAEAARAWIEAVGAAREPLEGGSDSFVSTLMRERPQAGEAIVLIKFSDRRSLIELITSEGVIYEQAWGSKVPQ